MAQSVIESNVPESFIQYEESKEEEEAQIKEEHQCKAVGELDNQAE